MSQLLKSAGLLGAGAYGYHQVENSDVVGNIRNVSGLFGSSTNRGDVSFAPSSSSAAGGEQMKILQGEVDRLHSLLSDVVRGQQRQGYTVIHTGKSGWTFYAYPIAGLALLYAYCRLRGISFLDLLYVSSGSMTQFKQTVTDGFSKIWEEVRKQKDELMVKLGAVGKKQEKLMESQAQMDERLRQVGDNVDDVKVNTHNINNRVTLLDGKMAEVRDGVANMQQGIMLLCHTVSEVTNRIGMNNTRGSQALKNFLTAPGSSDSGALPATQQQYCLPGPGGLAQLAASEDGFAAEVEPNRFLPEPTISVSAARREPSKSVGGPPSFPKPPMSKPGSTPSASSTMWGLGRS